MKKRLRKKKHLDEFAEWGRRLVIKRNRKDGFDDFLDNFIRDAIEANGCYCGGSGEGTILTVSETKYQVDDNEYDSDDDPPKS